MADLRLHRRQCLISCDLGRVPEDFVRVAVGDVSIAHDPALPVRTVSDEDGRRWAIVGDAVAQGGAEASFTLAACPTDLVVGRARDWTGRFLLIGGGSVHTDASALLGCLFVAQDGAVTASTSSALLIESTDWNATVDQRRLRPGRGIGWYPPPSSRHSGIDRLLPSQSLDLRTGAVSHRPLLGPIGLPSDDRDLQARIVGALPTQVDGRIWVALTAGLDSRLLLAAAVASGRRVATYTHLYPAMSLADRDLPPKLAASVDAIHHFIEPGEVDRRAAEIHDTHVASTIGEVDRELLIRGQWDFVEEGDLVLRGGCFEVGRRVWWHRLPRTESMPTPERICDSLGERSDPVLRDSLQRWIRWVEQHPEPGIPWADRFYLEQRLTGWLAAIEQSLDLVPGWRHHLANSADTFAAMLSIDPEQRRNGAHQRAMVARLAPALDEFPYNLRGRSFGLMRLASHRLSQDRLGYGKAQVRRIATALRNRGGGDKW